MNRLKKEVCVCDKEKKKNTDQINRSVKKKKQQKIFTLTRLSIKDDLDIKDFVPVSTFVGISTYASPSAYTLRTVISLLRLNIAVAL